MKFGDGMKWLDEHISNGGDPIKFVFDDRQATIHAWRSRGIFAFNCCQNNHQF